MIRLHRRNLNWESASVARHSLIHDSLWYESGYCLGKPTFRAVLKPRHWITYSRSPKSCNGIKGNFATWTRLGLFFIMTDAV
jgi:hypothetical protein